MLIRISFLFAALLPMMGSIIHVDAQVPPPGEGEAYISADDGRDDANLILIGKYDCGSGVPNQHFLRGLPECEEFIGNIKFCEDQKYSAWINPKEAENIGSMKLIVTDSGGDPINGLSPCETKNPYTVFKNGGANFNHKLIGPAGTYGFQLEVYGANNNDCSDSPLVTWPPEPFPFEVVPCADPAEAVNP